MTAPDDCTPAAWSVMGIGAEDIEANRQGRLGPNQRSRSRTQGWGFLLAGLALSYLTLKVGFVDGLRDDPHKVAGWLAPLVLGILFGGFFITVGVTLHLDGRRDVTVTSVTGPVSVHTRTVGARGGRQLRMQVGDQDYGLPLTLLSKQKAYTAALTAPSYRVYLKGGRIVVGLEPV